MTYHETPPSTRFYCPPHSYYIEKRVFIPKQAIFTHFPPFFDRSSVKYQPIFKWFSLSYSPQQALQHRRSKFVAKQTSLHQNNYYETFLRHIRFPCVCSVLFQAITISISRHVPSCRTEQFDTRHDFLGQKMTILENCISVRSEYVLGRDVFFKIAITNPIFVRFQNGFHLLVALSAV